VSRRIESNPLRAFDAKDESTRAVMAEAPKLIDRLSGEDGDHFVEVKALLDASGVSYTVDPTLVRGLDYYNRTVFAFECAELGAQSEIGGGGRYDGLVSQLGGPEAPGVGWAVGLERILLAAGEIEPTAGRDVFVAVVEPAQRLRATVLVNELRRKGLSAELDLGGRSLKGQLKQADRIKARQTVILEPGGSAQLKNMETGDQQQVDAANVLESLISFS